MARWNVWNQEAPENRIWRVTYGEVEKGVIAAPPSTAIDAATEQLRQALAEIALFARRIDCQGFANAFDAAHSFLAPGVSPDVYHRDLSPEANLQESAERLLAASQKAWVFGGMGSWNDMMFDGADQQEYERLSEGLFLALHRAIVAAANSSSAGNG